MGKRHRRGDHGSEPKMPVAVAATPSKKTRIRNIATAVVMTILIAATYASAISGVFLFDDFNLIVKNRYIQDIHYLPIVLSTGFGRIAITGVNYYRPLQEVSYMADFYLWGLEKAGYHITSIAFLVGVVLLLFFLLERLFKDYRLSLFVSLLVAVHPIYTSAVTYISGRADIASLFFILLSLFMLVKFLEAPERIEHQTLILLGVGLLAALLSKETSLIVFFMAPLLRFYRIGQDCVRTKRKKWALIYSCFVAVIFIYFILRMNAIKGIFNTQYNVVAGVDPIMRILAALKAITIYLGMLAFPTNMHLQRSLSLPHSLLDLSVVAGAALITGAIWAMIKAKKRDTPVYAGLAWFSITYLPVSNIIFPLNAFIAENWIQLPAIGIFVVVVYALLNGFNRLAQVTRLKAVKHLYLIILIPAVVWYAFLTMARNDEYSDPIKFYKSALRYEPRDLKLHNALALAYIDMDETIKSEELLKAALSIAPGDIGTMDSLGHLYARTGKLPQAIKTYEEVLLATPGNFNCMNNLGVVSMLSGDRNSAVAYWKRSLESNPNQPVILEYIKKSE